MSYPCIGYYNSKYSRIQKKIVYDIQIRGKPKAFAQK